MAESAFWLAASSADAASTNGAVPSKCDAAFALAAVFTDLAAYLDPSLLRAVLPLLPARLEVCTYVRTSTEIEGNYV